MQNTLNYDTRIMLTQYIFYFAFTCRGKNYCVFFGNAHHLPCAGSNVI